MNLQVHLLSRIAAAALVCLLATASLLLYRSDRQAKQSTHHTAETLGKQLELQLLKLGASLGHHHPFPDFEWWQLNASSAGDCIAFIPERGADSRHLCNGAGPLATETPVAFEALYRLFFSPGITVSRPIVFHGRHFGSLTVAPSAERELAEAWTDISSLMALSAITVLTICVLVYLSISRALLPSKIIVAGLEEMEKGNLAFRLPSFELNEWQYIAAAINQLAATQRQLFSERQELAIKLMGLQEEERRDLARELHDEFGQCLTAINAISLSIAQGAREHCPDLVSEVRQIREITQHMLDGIRDLLRRLRPAELDELGLQACLDSLIAGWNLRNHGATQYQLRISGDCASLPQAMTVALFRLVQECLTNIAKHAAATHACVVLTISADAVALTVRDDGRSTAIPGTYGVGLLGMRERVTALHGRLRLGTTSPHGLIVEIWLPLQPVAETTP